jgi:Ca-activated chloride channel family protein
MAPSNRTITGVMARSHNMNKTAFTHPALPHVRLLRLAAALLAACGATTLEAAAPESDELVTCRIETDRAVVPADKPETAIVKVTLAADRVASRERPPVNLALVLDRSGSMGGDKIARAREAALDAIRRLDARDTVSVVIYDHEVETLVPAQSARNIEWIEGRIAQIAARGNTALFAGLSQGASELRKHLDTGRINRAILLSDGLANTGPSSPDEVGRLGAALMKEAIAVTTIGVGIDYNEDLMTRVSGNSDGNSYFVEKSDDLPAIFTKELGDMLSVVASRVRLTVRFRSGATPIECIGRDGRIDGSTVTVDLNQLYGGQEKYLLVRVELAPGRDGESRLLADAEVSFEEATRRRSAQATASGRIRFSRDTSEVAKSVNVPVSREYTLNRNAQDLERAMRLADEGKKEEAARVMRESAGRLEAAATALAEPDLEIAARRQRAHSDEVYTGGLKKAGRKAIVTDNYMLYNQQQK